MPEVKHSNKSLAVIPARGGSKSIANKNIREFAGRPLIAWTIEAATRSRASRVVVTTDSEEIKRVAVGLGAEVPYLRSAQLSGDTVAIEPVIIDLLRHLREEEAYVPSCLLLLMPTSPFRKVSDIDRALDLFHGTDATCVMSASRAIANHNPHWMLTADASGKVTLFNGERLEDIKSRRQDLPDVFFRNDFVYAFDPANLYLSKPNLYGSNPRLMVVSDDRVDVDINTELDWTIAELAFRAVPSDERD